MKKYLLAVMALTLVACSGYKRTENGVIVTPKSGGAKRIRIEVMDEKIIHVSASPESRFADPASLIIVPQKSFTDFTVSEEKDEVVLSTAALNTYVNLTDGSVRFTDKEENTYTREVSKSFTPYSCTQIHANNEPETYTGYTTHLVFDSPSDEAFYGLGQHQADEWNWKNRNEELFQYNTKVSIPFVVSSRNYGILLDSYSLCRFGNPAPYEQIHRLFRLYDMNGVEGALTGTYTSPDMDSLVRREDSLYFENLKSAKNLPAYPLANAKVVYEGEIEPLVSGEYRFCHYYSGYQNIYVDGESVYNHTIWRTAWNPNARKFSLPLEAGRRYHFRLEWTPDGGEAYCGLRAYAPVDEKIQGQQSWWSEMTHQLDYYFMAGRDADEVIHGYRTLTGKAQMMPSWLLGYWQSRERYKTQDEIVEALRGFRQRHLPIDNIVMDWNYWTPDEWGAFTFDPTRFRDPQQMVDDIHAMNARIMISCWPKYYLTVDNFKELNDRGMIYQQTIRDTMFDWLGYQYAFYDAYDPEARLIFWRQLYEKLGTIGIDAWWMDASEPNVRDCTDEAYRKQLCGPTKYGSSDEFFNAYSIVNAEAIYDGQRAYETALEKGLDIPAQGGWNQAGHSNSFSPENSRVFLLTRNGFASEQRYSTATWSGDIGTRWEDMQAQVTAGLNFSISGVPYWSQDIGGFSVEKRYEAAQRLFEATGKVNEDLMEWRELNVRWHQWGMFTPMYRVHGQYPFREPWNIAPEHTEAYKAIRSCLELRYRLMPYLYSLNAMVHYQDYTMMRPLVMDFGTDEAVCDIAYQYMFGPAIMVCPVCQYGAREREVYFPKGSVWHSRDGRVITGGEIHMERAPFNEIPLFVRGGSILPMGEKMEYTMQRPQTRIELHVYAGDDGIFNLYEDEGINYGYEAGRFANIPLIYNDKERTLIIGSREGEFPGMLQERDFIVLYTDLEGNKHKGTAVHYTGEEITIKL